MKNKKIVLNNNKAFLIKKDNTKISYEIGNVKINNLKSDEVIIKVFYSCLNFKDILIGSGNPGLVRKYPHVPGIDCTGKVYYSNSSKFKKGDRVMVVARPIGINSFGTMSNYFVVPSKWVEKIPSKIKLITPIIFGTAGFTSMLAIRTLIENKVNKKSPILVTGASGGVGLISIFLLKNLGYNVVAATTKYKKNFNLLKKVGAKKIIDIKEFHRMIDLPILKKIYGAIIDNVGGNIISYGSKQLIQNLISVGNVRSNHSKINILTLILRGIRILGINAENVSTTKRIRLWNQIYKQARNKNLNFVYNVYDFNKVTKVFKKMLKNDHKGRNIFKF